MAKEIEIPYTPRDSFLPFHDSEKRWSVLICHRRAGKTVAAINHLIRDCIRKQGIYAYIAPYYNQAKRTVWDYVKTYTRPIPSMKYNEAELKATFPNGSIIYLFGADNSDALRGIGLDGVIFDEYSQQPAHIFDEIVAPMLIDRAGYAIFLGTIKGKNHLWRLWDEHKEDEKWYTLYLPASKSGILPQELLEEERDRNRVKYEQEYELSTIPYIEGGIYQKELDDAREQKRITDVPYDKAVPVYTAWDLGIGDATSIWFYQYVGQEIHVIDYYEARGEALTHYAKVIQDKGYVYRTHFLPHDAEARELGTGRTRIESLKSALGGHDIRVLGKSVVEDGINALRLIFNKMWFDEHHCVKGLDAIQQYRREWDDKRGDFKDKPLHDWTSHAADALRYMAMSRQTEDYGDSQPAFVAPKY